MPLGLRPYTPAPLLTCVIVDLVAPSFATEAANVTSPLHGDSKLNHVQHTINLAF